MRQPPSIDPHQTIREVLARYPQTAAVFERHGLAGCGGAAGPLEPLDQFALLHQVDLPGLLAELEAAARTAPPAAAAPPAASPPAPPDTYPLFLKTSLLVALSAGFGIGLLAVLSRLGGPSLGAWWLPLVQAHGQAQLLGWVGLFVVGVAYHVVPRFCGAQPPSRRVALATYGLLLGALLVRVIAQPLLLVMPLPGAYTLAALLQLAASVLFVATLARWLLPRRGHFDGWEQFLLSSGAWLVIGGLLGLGVALAADRLGSAIVASPLTAAYHQAMFYGFALLVALGVTRRAIPLFMGLRPTDARGALWACGLVNLGVILTAADLLGTALAPADGWRTLGLLGTLALLGGVLLFVRALHLFERAPQAPGPGQPRGHEPFVRAAYLWLLVALVLGVVVAATDALGGQPLPSSVGVGQRHALALGFLSLLMMGVASRIVPVFGGVRLWGAALLRPLFVAFNLGVALRVAGELLGNADPLARCLVALSGVFGFAGLALFALLLWRTLDRRPAVALPLVNAPQPVSAAGATALSPELTVAAVLERWPAALPVLVAHGFAPLANPLLRRAMAPRVTLAQAAELAGVELPALLSALAAATADTAPTVNTRGAAPSACGTVSCSSHRE